MAEEHEEARGAVEALVDVGLPAYRRAVYIGEAIESVLSQTLGRWRLTICDNGPGGGAIAEAVRPYLSDPRIGYLATGRELPLAESWTTALRQGTSAYVALLNDDDRWHPGFLQARVDALDSRPECGFAFSEWVQVDEDGAPYSVAPVRFPEGVLSREVLADLFTRTNPVVPPAIVVRRSAYEAVGPAFDGTWHYTDWEMWARLAARFPAYYLARQDNDYRRHPAANTFVAREDPEHLLAMLDHIEHVFARELGGFQVGRIARAERRSQILLAAAQDVHAASGWRSSGELYRRALKEYPPSLFTYVSLSMIGGTLLGDRGWRALSRLKHGRISKLLDG